MERKKRKPVTDSNTHSLSLSLSHTHTHTHTHTQRERETNEIFVLTCFYTVSMANIAGKYYSNYFFLMEF